MNEVLCNKSLECRLAVRVQIIEKSAAVARDTPALSPWRIQRPDLPKRPFVFLGKFHDVFIIRIVSFTAICLRQSLHSCRSYS
jgi:hypothetical protein